MTKLDPTTRGLLLADRALLLELAEQTEQAYKAAAALQDPTRLNVLASDAQKARDCALRAEVLTTVVRASQVDRRHPDAVELAAAGRHEQVWDYFDEQASA